LRIHESRILDRSYRSDIDGLRCIAILSVVLYHARVPHIIGGFTGVDIFFVISGYLIGGHIYSELRIGDFSYLRFYYRRAKRILPAFYTVLGFTLLSALLLLSPSEATDVGRSAFAAMLSSSNILFWKTTNYFNPTNELNPLLMTWSLGVEEQFYVLIPIMMAMLTRIRRNLVMPAILTVCAISFIFAWRVVAVHPIFVFFMLPARAWELGVGVALAVAERSSDRLALTPFVAQMSSAIGALSMLVPIFVLNNTTLFPGAAAFPSVAGTALVLASRVSWISRRLLSLSPFVFIGRISYSWYLWHWPLLAFGHILYGVKLEPIVSAVVVVSSFTAAVLSYFLIEQPLRQTVTKPSKMLMRYTAVGIAILAPCAGLWLSR
jgi:peptidoglycan/LPS O-acetylase OafA/YrhL